MYLSKKTKTEYSLKLLYFLEYHIGAPHDTIGFFTLPH